MASCYEDSNEPSDLLNGGAAYTAMSILMYAHGCNLGFLPYCTTWKEIYVLDNTTK
jgi:hypothetical protein